MSDQQQQQQDTTQQQQVTTQQQTDTTQQQASADPWWGKTDLGLDQDTANFYASRNAPSLAEALKSGMHAHKAVTDRNVLPKPDPAKLGEWSGWKELGWTENRADYKIESPKAKAPAGYPYNEQLETAALDALHKRGIPASLAQEIVHDHMAASYAQFQALETAFAQEKQRTEATLRGEWGQQYDARTALAQRALQWFGLSAEDAAGLEEVMGAAGLVKGFAKLGEALGEERLVLTPNGGGMGARSATTIQAEIHQLQADPAFLKALTDPRDPRHQQVNDQRNRLLEELAKVKHPA